MRKPIRLSWRPATTLLITFATTLLPTRSDAAGEIYWFSLLTEDAAAASTFYSGLFGWTIEPSPTGALMAVRDGIPIAGISQIEDRIPNASESMWLAAIMVSDLEKSVGTAKELGATVHEEITELAGLGQLRADSGSAGRAGFARGSPSVHWAVIKATAVGAGRSSGPTTRPEQRTSIRR